MGCGNCGSGANGKPSGCKSNGGCSTGGCNRMNVFDWLSTLPLHDSAKPYPVIEVSFNKGSRKEFYRNNTLHIPEKGEMIAVEGVSGFDIGQVSLTGELVKLQMKKYGVEEQAVSKRFLRVASEDDLNIFNTQKLREQGLLVRSRAIARNLKLEMKLAEIELQADGKKATFFYTADGRVDFRELIKVYASEFKVKVEMKQIGARQESAKVGGIGSCGRELCCSTWLTDFKSVNTTAARYQNLAINQTKLSGQCGRLKCCLNYELDTYLDALTVFPDNSESIQTIKGTATLQKRDIFKNLMWYSYSDSNKQYPLTIARVKEIMKANSQGIKPDELQPVELEVNSNKPGVKVDMGFVNDVGQISLKSLERSSSKNRNKNKSKSGQQGQGGDRPRNSQQNRPQQGGGGNKPQNQQRPQRQDQPQGQGQQQRPKQEGQGQQQRLQRQDQRPNQQQRPKQDQQGQGGNRPQQNQQRNDQRRQQPNNNNNRPQRPKQDGQGQQQQRPNQQKGENPNQPADKQ